MGPKSYGNMAREGEGKGEGDADADVDADAGADEGHVALMMTGPLVLQDPRCRRPIR